MIISLYRVYCVQENMYHEIWSETVPSTCPNNNVHQLDGGLTTIINTVNDDYQTVIVHGPKSQDGKLLFTGSPRPVGTSTYHTGYGDNPLDIDDVGNGNAITLMHNIGGGQDVGNHMLERIYCDFNTALNPSYIHSSIIDHFGVNNAKICCYAVSPVTVTEVVQNGDYIAVPFNGVSNALIIPVASGTGNLNIVGPALMEAAFLDNGTRGQGFFNAEIDHGTPKGFTNITSVPYGTGQYNMFAREVVFDRFVNLNLVSPGRAATTNISSHDISRIPHGLRLRIDIEIPKNMDSICQATVNIFMYRTRTFINR